MGAERVPEAAEGTTDDAEGTTDDEGAGEVERVPEGAEGTAVDAVEVERVPEAAEGTTDDAEGTTDDQSAVGVERVPEAAEGTTDGAEGTTDDEGAGEAERVPEVAEEATGGSGATSETGPQGTAVWGRAARGEEEDVTTTADQDSTGEDATVTEATLPSWATEPARPALDPLPTREAPERELLSLTGGLRDRGGRPADEATAAPLATDLALVAPPEAGCFVTPSKTGCYATPSKTGCYATPPAPEYRQVEEPAPELPAPLPPPREKTGAFGEPGMMAGSGPLYDTNGPAGGALDLAEPLAPTAELRELPGYEEGEPSRTRAEQEVIDYVGPRRRQELWAEIDELYGEVPAVLCTDEKQADALELLQQAQNILMEKPRQFDVARYKVGQVQSLITRRVNTVRWTNTYGWGMLAYEMLWFVGLSLAILYAPLVARTIEGLTGQGTSFITVSELWSTAAWGGIGGMLGALYSLYWHAAKIKDFDKQYVMWYVVQPVIGVVIGGLVYVIIGAGFFAALGQATAGGPTILSLFPYAVASIAAFRQRFILEIVDRIIQFLTSPMGRNDGQRQAEESTPEPGD